MYNNPKRQIVLTILLLTFVTLSNAQKIPAIVGRYHQAGTPGDGGGGTSIWILKNNRFAITGFGTFITGSWQINKENVVTLSPKNPEHPFVLFGRHNPNIKQGFKIMLKGFEAGRTFIGLENTGTMQRVFNEDVNCFPYPYVHQFNEKSSYISFTDSVYNEAQRQTYTYKFDNSLNDFIAEYIKPDLFYKPFYLIAKKDGLQFVGDKKVMRRINFTQKHLNELKEFEEEMANQAYFNDIIFSNPSYNIFETTPINIKEYIYNEKKNAYTNILNYIEGQELTEQNNPYDYQNLIYKYDKIKPSQINTTPLKINKNNLFEVKCK